MITICHYPHCYRNAFKRYGVQTRYCWIHLCEHDGCTKPVAETPLTLEVLREFGTVSLCEFHLGWMIGVTVQAWMLREWIVEQQRLGRFLDEEEGI